MPDPPSPKLHVHPARRAAAKQGGSAADGEGSRAVRASAVEYAELHCLSNFSFLRGASHPEELVGQAAALGYRAIAITDRNSLAGIVRAHVAAREHGIQLIVGAEITPADGLPIVLLAPTRSAYARLCRLITRGRLRVPKGACDLRVADLADLGDELIGIAVPGDFPPAADELACLRAYRDLLAERLYLAATLTRDVPDVERLARLEAVSRAAGAPLIATNAVHYHAPERRYLQDVLTCIREKCALATAGSRLFANAERHLRPLPEIARRYAGHEELVRRTMDVVRRCTFSLDELRYEYPHEIVPPGVTAMEHLERLTWEGARERYLPQAGVAADSPGASAAADGIPPRVRELIGAELKLIAELGYEHYFLTVYDLVDFARSRGILCQGRGSAANSAVCYCLGVTAVDPARIDVLFERFISKERNEPPDIDIDFEHERREEVFQYIYEKYGRERAGIVAEVITYRPRSAVRDVGKALGLSLDRVDAIAKTIDWWSREAVPEEALRAAGLDPADRTVQMLARLVRQLVGFPRHLSQHVGGFVLTESPLCEIVPLENGGLPGRTFIEWDKDDIDAVGLLKVDCLALGMLTAIRRCLEMLRAGNREQGAGNRPESASRLTHALNEGMAHGRDPRFQESGRLAESKGPCEVDVPAHRPHARERAFRPDQRATAPSPDPRASGAPLASATATPAPPVPSSLASIPPEDPAVYDMIGRADTVGVFQIESRAQMSMLPRLRPRCFYDLVIEVAIVRPGPIQGGMVHPYLRRRDGLEPVTYPSEAVRAVLGKTLGVPLFQEQVMKVAVVAAGFTPGEADQLRRSMAAWRRGGQIDKFQARLLEGMLRNGYSPAFAEQLFQQIRGFGEYGFPESHAASFALLVYASAWLKRYHPAAFCAALLNSQPMGFYAPAQLVADARRHGVTVLPVDVMHSAWDCTLEETGAAAPALRLGFRLVRGLSAGRIQGILAARDALRWTDQAARRFLPMLAGRPDVSRDTLLRLAAANAFRSLGLDRRQAIWQILALDDGESPLFAGIEPDEAVAPLPALSLDEAVVQDYDAVGFSLSAHPIGLLRGELSRLHVTPCEKLKAARHRQRISVAGLVTHRQRPGTAKGIVFMTLEDETGSANLIIRPPVWERFKLVARTRIALVADGTVERQGEVVHVQVTRVRDLSAAMAPVRAASRDFH